MIKKILFLGELTPNIVHGISLSNRLNIDLLKDDFDISIVEEISNLKEHTKRSSSKIKKNIFYVKEMFRLNKKYNYDYFYTVFSFSTFGSLKTLAVLACFSLAKKGKIILHIHRGDFELFYKKNILNRLISKFVFRLISKLIVLSNNQKKEFSQYLEKDKIFVLENSLKDEVHFSRKNIGTKNFIYISNYIKEKGIFELLEVFKSEKMLKLECFGEFVNNETEIRKYESKSIKINSFINGEDKYRVIYKSDALILPSWNEGQPTIILEAMMIGTIVLTTKVGLIPELLGEDYPFYFKAKNIKSLEKCIKKFIEYEHKDILSKKLQRLYFEKYSKKIHKEKLLNIFEVS